MIGSAGSDADDLDEVREIPGNLRIAGRVVGGGGRDGLRLAELVDLHDPGDDGAVGRLPDETAGETHGQRERAEGHQPPVLGLHPSRADAVVPHLGGALIGGFRLGRSTVANGGAAKQRHLLFSSREIDGMAAAMAVAGPEDLRSGLRPVDDRLVALHALGPGRWAGTLRSAGGRRGRAW